MIPPDVVPFVARLSLLLLTVAVVLTFVRLAIGPTLPDRVVALDVIATLVVGMIGIYAVITGEPIFLRVAMVVALINFIGTVGFSQYLEKRGQA